MRALVALMLATVREHVTARTVFWLLGLLVLWTILVAATGGAPSEGSEGALQRGLAVGMTFIGGAFAVFVGAAGFSEEIRTRRFDLIATRPVPMVSLVLGKTLGAALATGIALLPAFLLGSAAVAWTGGFAAVYDIRRATAVERGGVPVERGSVLTLTPSDPPLVFRASGVEPLGDRGELTLRLDVLRRGENLAPRSLARVEIRNPESGQASELEAILHRRRSVPMSLADESISKAGEVLVSVVPLDGPTIVRVSPDALAIRAREAGGAKAWMLQGLGIACALALLACVGTAASTALSAPTAAALGFFWFAFGAVREFALDMAGGLDRVARMTTDAGSLADLAVRIDAGVLRGLGTVAPPLASFPMLDRIARGEAPELSTLLLPLGWLGLHLLVLVPLASWVLLLRRIR